MAYHNDLGREGEQLAVAYLQKQHYHILERNWRYLKAEIDIIAFKDEILVITEVKTRTTDVFGAPEDFITKTKIQLLITAAHAYVEQRQLDVEVRFDVIAILKEKDKLSIKHIEEAFLPFE